MCLYGRVLKWGRKDEGVNGPTSWIEAGAEMCIPCEYLAHACTFAMTWYLARAQTNVHFRQGTRNETVSNERYSITQLHNHLHCEHYNAQHGVDSCFVLWNKINYSNKLGHMQSFDTISLWEMAGWKTSYCLIHSKIVWASSIVIANSAMSWVEACIKSLWCRYDVRATLTFSYSNGKKKHMDMLLRPPKKIVWHVQYLETWNKCIHHVSISSILLSNLAFRSVYSVLKLVAKVSTASNTLSHSEGSFAKFSILFWCEISSSLNSLSAKKDSRE